MNTIKKFLLDHPLISINGLEKQCDIPKGTLRLSSKRDIPEKYKQVLNEVLTFYGLNHKEFYEAIHNEIMKAANLITDNIDSFIKKT